MTVFSRRGALLLAGLSLVASSVVPELEGVSASVARQQERRATPQPRCVRQADRARILRFRAADRTPLVGVTVGRGRTGVVLAHSSRGDLCQWMPYARVLARSGYRVLAFDFRGSGLSSSPPFPRAEHLYRDVAAGARLLRSLGSPDVAVIGASMGGTVSLHAATLIQPAPLAAVSLSAPASWGRSDGAQAVTKLQIPVLLVAAERDSAFADDARALFAAVTSSQARLEIVPGGEHGAAMLRSAAVRGLITDFLASARR